MEEFDSHTEHASEQAHEAALEAREKWITGVALTAAILAALAAITSMLAGHHEHDAMMEQMAAVDKWNQYQAKKIKTILREERLDSISMDEKKVRDDLQQKIGRSKVEEESIAVEAREFEESSKFHDNLHMFFASAVTLFQVAIAVSAVSALTRRRAFWNVGIALGTVALGFLVAGLLVNYKIVGSHAPEPEIHAAAPA